MSDADDGPRFRGEHLLRVIVLPEGTWLAGWKIQSVELYGDGVRVRAWKGSGSDHDDLSIEIEDDLGTDYDFAGGGGEWDSEAATSESAFTPAVPDAAAVLTLVSRGEPVKVALS